MAEILGIILGTLVIVFISMANALNKSRQEIEKQRNEYDALQKRFDSLGGETIEETRNVLENLNTNIENMNKEIANKKQEICNLDSNISKLIENEQKYEKRVSDFEKKVENQKVKFQKNRDLYSAMTTAMERYYTANITSTGFKPLTENQMKDVDSLAPSVLLNLNSMNYQDLRKKFLNNQKQIEEIFEKFSSRYTTKGNQSLYQLMVISLSAELQNILTKLKYGKLDEGLNNVHTVINKFISIADEGSQTIAGTMKQFIYTIEKLFEDAVNIEYEYYIKKEQARQEQLALKAKMREEREEQRRLAEQAEQMRKEAEKYYQEQERLCTKLAEAKSDDEKTLIESDLAKLKEQLEGINAKQEEITKLQHGKAGNVYIISNLGSFGDDIFKIGMTRRLDPQERVDELGSASVPFGFDVHSFIFSEDAPALETELHKRLNDRRVNKVNKRKEFFKVSLDDLEKLVNEIYPSAEFNKTMLAEEYKQSLSLTENAFSMDDEDYNEIDLAEDV